LVSVGSIAFSIRNFSTPTPPTAAPTPNATVPVFSPSSLRVASTVMSNFTFSFFSFNIFSIAVPGLPVNPPGPRALIMKSSLLSN
jgi:hypothetical protein